MNYTGEGLIGPSELDSFFLLLVTQVSLLSSMVPVCLC